MISIIYQAILPFLFASDPAMRPLFPSGERAVYDLSASVTATKYGLSATGDLSGSLTLATESYVPNESFKMDKMDVPFLHHERIDIKADVVGWAAQKMLGKEIEYILRSYIDPHFERSLFFYYRQPKDDGYEESVAIYDWLGGRGHRRVNQYPRKSGRTPLPMIPFQSTADNVYLFWKESIIEVLQSRGKTEDEAREAFSRDEKKDSASKRFIRVKSKTPELPATAAVDPVGIFQKVRILDFSRSKTQTIWTSDGYTMSASIEVTRTDEVRDFYLDGRVVKARKLVVIPSSVAALFPFIKQNDEDDDDGEYEARFQAWISEDSNRYLMALSGSGSAPGYKNVELNLTIKSVKIEAHPNLLN